MLFLAWQSFGQEQPKRPLKFEGEIDGIFEVVQIDTTKSVNLIRLKLKKFSDAEYLRGIDIPKNYEAVIYAEKVELLKREKDSSIVKLQVGSEYYFELKHMFFYNTLFPAPNEIPYALAIDGTVIWAEKEEFGIYNTSQLNGLFYSYALY